MISASFFFPRSPIKPKRKKKQSTECKSEKKQTKLDHYKHSSCEGEHTYHLIRTHFILSLSPQTVDKDTTCIVYLYQGCLVLSKIHLSTANFLISE